jgi:hypothetical protein
MQLCRQVNRPCSRDTGHEFKIWFRVSLLPQSLHLSVPLLPQFFKLLRVGRKSIDARTAKLRTPFGRLKINDLHVRSQDWRSRNFKRLPCWRRGLMYSCQNFFLLSKAMFLISDLVFCHDLLSDFWTAYFWTAFLYWIDKEKSINYVVLIYVMFFQIIYLIWFYIHENKSP